MTVLIVDILDDKLLEVMAKALVDGKVAAIHRPETREGVSNWATPFSVMKAHAGDPSS